MSTWREIEQVTLEFIISWIKWLMLGTLALLPFEWSLLGASAAFISSVFIPGTGFLLPVGFLCTLLAFAAWLRERQQTRSNSPRSNGR